VNLSKTLLLATLIHLPVLMPLGAETSEVALPEVATARKDGVAKKERRNKRERRLERLKTENPKLYQEFMDARGSWKDLTKEQRRQARRNWIQATPEAAEFLGKQGKNNRHRKRLKKLESENPKLHEKLKSAREGWKGLSREERKKARKDWIKKTPEAGAYFKKQRKQRRKQRRMRLKSKNPALYDAWKQNRRDWQEVGRKEKRKAREQWMEKNPEARAILHPSQGS
jgi:hypothetical protein